MYGYRSSFVHTDGNANGVTVIPGDPLIQLLPTTSRFAWSNANTVYTGSRELCA